MGYHGSWVFVTVFAIPTVLVLSLFLVFQSGEDVADVGAGTTEMPFEIYEPLVTLTSGAFVTIIPEEINVKKFINDSYYVSCQTSDCLIKAQWFNHRNKTIDTSSKNRIRVEMGFGTDLFLTGITTQDAGVYMCVTPKGVASFNLTVIRPIIFDLNLGEQSVTEGQAFKMKCEAVGHCNPKIIWKVDHLEPKAPKFKVTKDSGLIIHSVTQMDARKHYTCIAMDMCSPIPTSKVMNITLNVKMKPKLLKGAKTEFWGTVGEWVNLTCVVNAQSPAKFEWSHKNRTPWEKASILNPQENMSILEILVRNNTMFGEYTCRARNEIGSLQTTMSLKKAQKPPTPVLELDSVARDKAYIRIKELLNTTGDPQDQQGENMKPLPIIEYVFQIKKMTRSNWNMANSSKHEEGFLIKGLEAGIVYEVRARCKNISAFGDFSQRIIVVSATSSMTFRHSNYE